MEQWQNNTDKEAKYSEKNPFQCQTLFPALSHIKPLYYHLSFRSISILITDHVLDHFMRKFSFESQLRTTTSGLETFILR
jgi:hypothetical protein